jgi:hypothetical protein
MKTIIEVIPAEELRYESVGDWYLTNHCGPNLSEENMVDSWDEADTLHIKVAKMNDPRHEDLVILHELAEALMCRHEGVTPGQVDEFDKAWKKKFGDAVYEPGNDPDAPHFRQHLLATAIENMVAGELEVNLDDYSIDLDEAWKARHGTTD